jgi:hypothetical protein
MRVKGPNLKALAYSLESDEIIVVTFEAEACCSSTQLLKSEESPPMKRSEGVTLWLWVDFDVASWMLSIIRPEKMEWRLRCIL